MKTVLAKVYRGSGRPDGFAVVPSNNRDEIARLVEGFQYSVVDNDKPDDYTVDQAWDEYTYNDADGFTQWK